MPDEIEVDAGWIPPIPTSTKRIVYVRKDLAEVEAHGGDVKAIVACTA